MQQPLEVAFLSSTDDSATLSLRIPIRVLSSTATLRALIQLKEGLAERLLRQDTFYPPFFERIVLQRLPPRSMFRVEVRLIDGDTVLQSNVHIYTRVGQVADLPEELDPMEDQDAQVEEMMRRTDWVEQRRGRAPVRLDNDRDYGRFLCNSQKLVVTLAENDPFIDHKRVDKILLHARKQRSLAGFIKADKTKHTLLVAQTMQVLDDISRGPGRKFLKNDWFMGPFYSYDRNLRRN